MEKPFPLALGVDTQCVRLAPAAGQPEGRFYGYVSSGVPLPDGGSFYVVEFDPSGAPYARIVGYGDKYGRVFSADAPVPIPPARYPDVCVVSDGGTQDEGEAYSLKDNAFNLVGSFEREGSGDAIRYRISKFERPSLFDMSVLSAMSGYREFMTHFYLTFSLFAETVEASMPFDLGAIHERLSTSNLFDAVNKEVLEAEAAWDASAASAGVERFLVRMLHEAGTVGKTAADLSVTLADGTSCTPEVRLIRTSRYADLYYVDFSYAGDEASNIENGLFRASSETAAGREALLRTEAALNRFVLLTEYINKGDLGFLEANEGYCAQADQWLSDRICVQTPDPREAKLVEGRWEKHFAFASACEGLRLPYRLGYEFRSNEAGTVFGVNVSCPTANVMPQSAWRADEEAFTETSASERNGAEARYAAHAAILMAGLAFSVSQNIESVYVNCLRGAMRDAVIVTGRIDRAAFCEQYAAAYEGGFSDPFAFLRACGATVEFGEEYRLNAVPACFALDEGQFKNEHETYIDRDETPFSDHAREVLGVSCPRELSIFEDRVRERYADEVCDALDRGVAEAVDCLKGIHDRCEDVMLRRICTDLMLGFTADELDEQSYLEVKEAMVDPYGFKALMARASAYLRSGDEAHALDVLKDLQAKTDAIEDFKDTAGTCYRYFDTYESRLMYSLYCAEDAQGRRVLPLPDAAYMVHDALAQVYTNSLGSSDKALEHAKRCMEIAPSRARSYLLAARAHFMNENYQAEIEMCCKALRFAWRLEDADLCWYWMAFAFWKLERFDLAAVCYVRCINLRGPMHEQAFNEFGELIENVKGLQRRSEAEEREILTAAGVLLDAFEENGRALLDMARESVDCGCTTLGCVLAVSGMRIMHDDALMPTISSFAVFE